MNNSDIFQKRNPQILSQDIKVDSRPTLILDQNNFSLAIGLADDNNSFLVDSSIFSLRYTVYSQEFNNTLINITEFIMQPCEETDYSSSDIFEKMKLNGTYCLPKKIIKLDGYWNENKINYIYIDLLKCVNSSSNHNSCQSNEIIEMTLNNRYFEIYINNPKVDLSDFENPIKQKIDVYYQSVSSNLYKTIDFHLKSISITTDLGMFFESLEYQNNFVIDDYIFDFRLNDQEKLYSINIYVSEIENKITRKYEKIQDILAKFGGICNVLMILGFFLSKLENNFNFSYDVMNKLYHFKKPVNYKNSEKKESLKNISRTLPKRKRCTFNEIKNNISHVKFREGKSFSPHDPALTESFVFDSASVTSGKIQNIHIKNMKDKVSGGLKFHKLNSFKEFEKKNKSFVFEKYTSLKKITRGVSFGFWKYLKLLIKNKKFGLSDNEKLYLSAEERILEEFDIINIIKKLQDIEKLKKILLTENQLYFFELLSKPTIALTNDKIQPEKTKILNSLCGFQNKDLTLQNFSNLYEEMKCNSEKNLTDKKILEMLDVDILYMLNK